MTQTSAAAGCLSLEPPPPPTGNLLHEGYGELKWNGLFAHKHL